MKNQICFDYNESKFRLVYLIQKKVRRNHLDAPSCFDVQQNI